jgi:DNA-binding IclR family transcriptional regulator
MGVMGHTAMARRRAALLLLLLLGSADGRVMHSSVHRSMVGRHLSIGIMSGSYLPYYATAAGVVTWQELSAENGGG